MWDRVVVPSLKFLLNVKKKTQDIISTDVNKGLRKYLYKAEDKNKDTVDRRVC